MDCYFSLEVRNSLTFQIPKFVTPLVRPFSRFCTGLPCVGKLLDSLERGTYSLFLVLVGGFEV